VISDTGMPSLKHPALTYSLRGIIAFEITAARSVARPALRRFRRRGGKSGDGAGRCWPRSATNGRIPFPVLRRRRAAFKIRAQQAARYPLKDAQLKKLLGSKKLFGERGFTPTEQRSARPTFEINGLTSGYQGEGSKTIVPAWARAKITCRLVPDQGPRTSAKSSRPSQENCPPTVRMEMRPATARKRIFVSPTGPLAQAALRALEKAFGCKPILMREGGSIPIVNQFKKFSARIRCCSALGLPDDNAHSPNEKFTWTALRRASDERISVAGTCL
jgi:acetylornithine deacetylase/succinyl-diaminopimelate desuccinylase-like protein